VWSALACIDSRCARSRRQLGRHVIYFFEIFSFCILGRHLQGTLALNRPGKSKLHSPSHFLLRLPLVSKLFRVITMTELFQAGEKVPIYPHVSGSLSKGSEGTGTPHCQGRTSGFHSHVTSMPLSFEPFRLNNSSQDSTLTFFCRSRPKACNRVGTDLKPSTECKESTLRGYMKRRR
jgi:hypothetical protein